MGNLTKTSWPLEVVGISHDERDRNQNYLKKTWDGRSSTAFCQKTIPGNRSNYDLIDDAAGGSSLAKRLVSVTRKSIVFYCFAVAVVISS